MALCDWRDVGGAFLASGSGESKRKVLVLVSHDHITGIGNIGSGDLVPYSSLSRLKLTVGVQCYGIMVYAENIIINNQYIEMM